MGWVSVEAAGRNTWPSFVEAPGPVYTVYRYNDGEPGLYGYAGRSTPPVLCTRDEADSWRAAGAAFLDGLRAAERELPNPMLIRAGWLSRVLSGRTRARWRESRRAMARFMDRWRALDSEYREIREAVDARLAEAFERRADAEETLRRSDAEAERAVWGYVASGTPPSVYAYRHDVEPAGSGPAGSGPAGSGPAGDAPQRSAEPLRAFDLGQAVVAVTGTDHAPIVWDPHARAATEAATGRPFDEWWQAHGGAYRIRERQSTHPGTTHGTSHHSSHGIGYHA